MEAGLLGPDRVVAISPRHGWLGGLLLMLNVTLIFTGTFRYGWRVYQGFEIR